MTHDPDPEEVPVPDEAVAPEHSAVAVNLGAALRTVADATPVVDRRADLLAALDDGADIPGPYDNAAPPDAAPLMGPGADPGRRRQPTRRLLQVAAALVVVVAVAAVAAVVRDRGGDTERAGPDGPSTMTVPGPVDDPDFETGWYLPGPGWTITAVQTDYLDVSEGRACPCRAWAAAGPGDPSAVLDLAESAVPESEDDAPDEVFVADVDVGGRRGLRTTPLSEQGREIVRVDAGGRRIAVWARGVPEEALVAVLDAWADRVEADREVKSSDLPLPEGYVGSDVQLKQGAFEHLLAVTAEGPGGENVEYQLVPTGYQRSFLFQAVAVGPGTDGSLLAQGVAEGGAFVGAIGGPVDLTAGPAYFGGRATSLDRAGLAAFVDGLHEVSAEEWRAALPADGDVADDVRVAPSLFAAPLTG